MSIIVTDFGFSDDDWNAEFITSEQLEDQSFSGPVSVDVDPDTTIASVVPFLGSIALIRVKFASFADGRGMSIGRRLRSAGFQGRLRAAGHVLADQYAMVRRAGFDEVEISDELAARQTEDQWMARANWQSHDYQSLLRGSFPKIAL